MKRISLEDLLKKVSSDTYQQQYNYILDKIEQGKIRPLKASGLNGKKPALYRDYWILEEKKDYSVLIDELKYSLSPEISIDYYLKHPDVYEDERNYVRMLDDFLKDNPAVRIPEYSSEAERNSAARIPEHLSEAERNSAARIPEHISEAGRNPVSVNERSFEIWHREKFLTREQGKRILKHCGIDLSRLMTYETSEPMAYYTHTRGTPQNILFIENKDTYYTMRKYLLSNEHGQILGTPVGTLIYGGGKRILKSCLDFSISAEPYMMAQENEFLYFGDLDYEGIRIFEDFRSRMEEKVGHRSFVVHPFRPAYEAMIKKAELIGLPGLPETKEEQNRHISEAFFAYFETDVADRMKEILGMERYIPQEILNINDLAASVSFRIKAL